MSAYPPSPRPTPLSTTATPPPQTVRTTTVCRVLSLGRPAYQALLAAFPLSAEKVLDNLLEAAQEVGVRREGVGGWGGVGC